MVNIDQQSSSTGATTGVGALLRAARQRAGQEIGEVAQALRIRLPYLEAIEDGRINDLPGSAYAIGFVRAYAEHLGLDSAEVVRRFKLESAGNFKDRNELHMPSPVSEGRGAGGAVVFVGLLIAVVSYGAWNYLSTKESSVAEMVPPLPERLTGLLSKAPEAPTQPQIAAPAPETAPTDAAPSGQTAPAGQAAPADQVRPDEAASSTASAPSAPTAAAPQTAPAEAQAPINEMVPPADDEPSEASVQPPAAPVAPVKPLTKAEIKAAKAAEAKAAAEAAKAAKAEQTPAAPAAPEQAAAPVAAAVPPAPAIPAAPAEPAQTAGGTVHGEANKPGSRMTIHASDDSWIQIRDSHGAVVVTRLLKKGDSYVVPNRPGLTLKSGNAGATEVIVDGKRAAALGNVGEVKDVSLDPDRLQPGE